MGSASFLAQPPSDQVMSDSLTKVVARYSKKTAANILYICNHMGFVLEEPKSLVTSQNVCVDITVCIVDAWTNLARE